MSQKYEILSYLDVPTHRVIPNTMNPRPSFHLSDDDPNLVKLGDSIRSEGQHRPGLIYEQVGHWSLPDKPGHYVILQGESRWRGCQIAGVDTYRALLVPTPKSELEEFEWLGIEESHKRDWGLFFVLRFAWQLAEKRNLPVVHADIATLTGLTLGQLRLAHKISQLAPEVQGLVAEYEEMMYETSINGRRPKHARLRGSGVRTKEFTPHKAGLVYDIFSEMRANLHNLVREYDDATLQAKIASFATRGASHDDLENLLSAIRSYATEMPPGLLTQIADLLEDDQRKVRDVTRAVGHTQANKLIRLTNKLDSIITEANRLTKSANQLGTDPERLSEVALKLLHASQALNALERSVTDRRSALSNKV